jgi:hypothetical protein
VRLAAALFWVERQEISVGRGAQVAGMPYASFIDELAAAKIEALAPDIEELRRELARE